MHAETIARNYAEALLALARKANDLDGWGLAINGVVTAMESDARLSNFLAAPQVSAAEKNVVIGKAFNGQLPPAGGQWLDAEAAGPPPRGRGPRATAPGEGLSARPGPRADLVVLHAGGSPPRGGQGPDLGEL